MPHLIHHNLEISAQKYPDKTAFISDEDSITYQQLNEAADRLAAYLGNFGVARGQLVGVLLPKNIGSLIAIHGIMKTGAAFVPIDPKFPASRVAFILEDCDIKCLVTTRNLYKHNLQAIGESALDDIILTDDSVPSDTNKTLHSWLQVMNNKYEVPVCPCTSQDLAYLLFTSGSTGKPKGVMTSHQNAMSFIESMMDLFEVNEQDKIANPAPLQFGISTFDMYVGIKAGATMRFVPPTLLMFPQKLAQWMDSESITIWFSVPFVLARMLLEGEIHDYEFANLRQIFFAGEVFPIKYLREMKAQLPHVNFCNIYGTSEANIITYHRVGDLEADRTKPIPIGKPIPNLNVFAMKPNGEICQPGEEGELCTYGLMVTHGYWKNPQKTQECYIQNPLQTKFNEIAYKTGDLVVRDQSDDYHFVGRKDHMIKSRGYRIEIGDIEAAIYSHDLIKEVTVLGIPDDLIGHRIKAFISLHQNNTMDALAVQEYCSDLIPRYMIPQEIDIMESLPKTASGKIDKALLKQSQ